MEMLLKLKLEARGGNSYTKHQAGCTRQRATHTKLRTGAGQEERHSIQSILSSGRVCQEKQGPRQGAGLGRSSYSRCCASHGKTMSGRVT